MEQIIYSLQEYKLLVAAVGFIIIMIETFIPVLPLVAIVGANTFVLGIGLGFSVSWIGSSIGSIVLFLICKKCSDSKFVKRLNNKKTEKFKKWVKRQGFGMMFIVYLCPFIPDFLITITAGISKMKLRDFVPGMILGKFIMFLVISYIGSDIKTFITDPLKVISLIILVLVFWILGNKVNKRINSSK